MSQWYPVLSSVLPDFIFIPFPVTVSHVCEELMCSFSDIGNLTRDAKWCNEGNPHLCLFCLQTLAGGDGGRSHGDGQTGASSGVGVSDL